MTNAWFPNLWSSAGFVSTCGTLNLSPWFLCVLRYFGLEIRPGEQRPWKSVTLIISVSESESCRSIIFSNREVKSQILQPKPCRTGPERYLAHKLTEFPFAWLQLLTMARLVVIFTFSVARWRPCHCWWRILTMTVFYHVHKELWRAKLPSNLRNMCNS